jgi:hypothetical protein
MSKPSTNPTIAELYLAFRQAKTALYFERRGVGLLELAKYEAQLPANLNALKRKVANGKWFDGVKIGETWVVPKRLNETEESNDGVVRIGLPKSGAQSQSVDVQLRLSPHPDFAIVEVLYLWRFGGLLDSLLSKRDVLGYRLDLRKQQVGPHRRWLFEYWPKQYQAFRTAPLRVANASLKQGDETLIVSGDLASFYDTIDPSFMRSASMIAALRRRGASKDDLADYEQATGSLLNAYARFHREASKRVALPIALGVPIGALTSRVVANLSLATLDRYIVAQPDVLCYRRYVDDLVIVARAMPSDRDVAGTIRQFLPLVAGDADVLQLDVDALDRQGSEFQLQKKKVRVHRLHGVQGSDFVEAVAADFKKVVSEHRAFVDSSTFAGDGVSHLIRVGEANGSPLRVLREADRARLERFALATSLASLERVSSLIGHDEARGLVRERLERFSRVLDAEDNWVADLDVSLRLLKIAISVGDWGSVTERLRRMDRLWGAVDKLRLSATKLCYRNRQVPLNRKAPWLWLRNYLHERRIEAISAVLPIGLDAAQIAKRFPGGLTLRTVKVGATALRRRAEQLAAADLRARDREDDALASDQRVEFDQNWLRVDVKSDAALSQRLMQIDKFVRRCKERDDRPWLMPAARLFLCTRPPSYFDIARRWLCDVEIEGFAPDVFRELLAVVNAVRGTEYADAVGEVVDASTVSILGGAMETALTDSSTPRDPRIILGNLSVDVREWDAAATRTHAVPHNSPRVTVGRLARVARILHHAFHAARDRVPALLVLPELSLPREWFRSVSNHVVRRGQFGLVTGLEYLHDPKQPYVSNQVFAVLPGPFGSVATWPWTKRLPAYREMNYLGSLKPPVSFAPPPSGSQKRVVVRSPWGAMSVLVCSELIEARRIADLLGRVDVVLCPAWNQDTSSFDHLIQSAGLQLHAIIAIANNGHYSDCRAWAPRRSRPERELCRLIERGVDDVVQVDIPLRSLVAFHRGALSDEWRPLPPDWPYGAL